MEGGEERWMDRWKGERMEGRVSLSSLLPRRAEFPPVHANICSQKSSSQNSKKVT